ncbi:MAG: FeoB-associated Cys-rich membrane protein [Kiritimatiellia bacterium]|nr:FeoB-associated Cys-rich membrane protein [Kiritimatiellia bacterium]
MERILVGLVVVGAVAALLRTLFRSLRGGRGRCACGSDCALHRPSSIGNSGNQEGK